MQGIGRSSLQLNATLSSTDTSVITLTLSNDGVNFVPFAINKTVTMTGGGTTSYIFELGVIDYVFLRVTWGAPSAGTLTLRGVMYGIDSNLAMS